MSVEGVPLMLPRRTALLTIAVLALALAPRPGGTLPAGADGQKKARTDLHGDALPAGARARLGTVRWRHPGTVIFVALSPDGRVLASSWGNNTLSLWDAATGRELHRIRGVLTSMQGTSPVVFTAGGKHLVGVGEDGGVRTWDVATGKELHRAAPRPGGLVAFTFARDGKTLALLAGDRSLRVWDVAAGKERAVLAGPPVQQQNMPVFMGQALGLSADGKTLAVAGFKQAPTGNAFLVQLWDVVARKQVRLLDPATPNGIFSVFVAPDGKTLGINDATRALSLWEVATGKLIRRVGPRTQYGSLVEAFSPDSKRLASASGNQVLFEELASGKEVGKIVAGNSGVSAVAFSADGRLVATGGADHLIRVWDPATGKEVSRHPAGHRGYMTGMAYSPDGRLVASSGVDGTVRLWDPATGKGVRVLERPEKAADGQPAGGALVEFSADGRTLTAAWFDGMVSVWETASGKAVRRFRAPGPPQMMAMALSSGGRLLARAGQDGQVRLIDVGTGRVVRRFGGAQATPPAPGQLVLAQPGAAPHFLAFSPDGRTLLEVGQNGVNPYMSSGLVPARGYIAWNGNVGPAIRLREVRTGKVRGAIQLRGGGGLYGGGDLSILADGTSNTIYLGGMGFGGGISNAVFSPDGRTLALGDGLGVLLYDLGRRRELRRLDGPDAAACFRFSPDGKLLAIGSSNGSVTLWDVAAGTEVGRAEGHDGSVSLLRFAPDGRTLVSAGMDTTLLAWDVAALRDEARRERARGLPAARLQQLWDQLAGADAAAADRALWTLADFPKQSVPFVKGRVRAVAAVEAGRIARLVADLDSDSYTTRKRASEELEKLGELAEAALRELVAGRPSLEVRRRAETLLDRVERPITAPDQLRQLRAVELLEKIGTPEARQVLEQLARGAPQARLTRDAREALERLDQRPAGGP